MTASNIRTNSWRILFLLFLANLFNFFDRMIPSVVAEPMRKEWGLSDAQLGLAASAFTVVYAIAGLPLGRLADRISRKKILGMGLLCWSVLTGMTGLAWNFASFFLARLAVGVGEACYAPAATSLIGDLFPANKRSRAMGIFMLGLPIGVVLAFFGIGWIVKATGDWKMPFFIAAVPGVLLAMLLFFIREPARGASEPEGQVYRTIENPIRHILAKPTVWWIIVAGTGLNMAAYAANSFIVPLIQRYYHQPIQTAALAAGIILGLSGLIGLTVGATVADRLHRLGRRTRLLYGALSMLVSAVLIWIALSFEQQAFASFVALFSLGWLLQYNFYTCAYPAMQEIVPPNLRATAMAIFFAVLYLFGGAAGPVIVGALSDHAANAAMVQAGATTMTDAFKGIGLREAMIVIPVALTVAGIALVAAMFTFVTDAAQHLPAETLNPAEKSLA